jgi:OmcA/MtrC family decaheme c-type cytochrome
MVMSFLSACNLLNMDPIDITTMTPEQRAEITGVHMPLDSIKVTIGVTSTRVTYLVTDTYERPLVGLETLVAEDDRYFRFNLCKLVAGENGDPDSWHSYILNEDGQPSYDSPRQGGTVVANKDNTYTYTFAYNVSTDAAYTRSVTTRLGGQMGNRDAGIMPLNVAYDFMPNGAPVTTTRDIALTTSCNECHDPLNIHGRRFEVGYCVTCHNPGLLDGDDSYDMSVMTHMIHNADPDYREGEFAEITYPQELLDCRKCHNGDDPGSPQGDNWKNAPSMEACGSCHTDVDFAAGTGHIAQTDNASCATCHTAEDIETDHVTPMATPNNPNLPAGVPEIVYGISSVTVDGSGAPTIIFTITADGTPLDLTNLDPALRHRYPGFLLAWAEPQDGITEPIDYNNLGEESAQPISVSLEDVVAGTDGTITCGAADGSCTATLTAKFPTGAILRAVGLQGYFRIDTTGDDEYDYSLHTPSVLMAVTGDEERRTVVDSVKCANCHEWFEGHGGNRVYNMQICVMCHVPNLSSSGREITDPSDEVVAELGSDTLSYPEATQNMKEMIHGIHASAVRTTDYEHVRDRNDGIYYNWSEVTFPAETSNCLLCHDGDTYELPLDENVLVTTNRTTGVSNGLDATPDDVLAARESLPNDTDFVISPISGSCYFCHDSEESVSHMEINGGSINVNRVDLDDNLETCDVCHGSGRDHSMDEVHMQD